MVTPKTGEKFTEFYVLGLNGEAANYPNELTVGEEEPYSPLHLWIDVKNTS
ncbi:MAG: DUF1616 domain-containing protein [Dehalococcoidia bacterium]|nr:DUF1616 domain-containing protein [Dehalococcoidia bacterium]